MYAGIDCGSTLIKVALATFEGGKPLLLSFKDEEPAWRDLEDRLRASDVRRVRATGIGAPNLYIPGGFEIIRPDAPVEDEIALQANGVRHLLSRSGFAPKKILIASVGTGVSYTTVTRGKAKRSPLGSAHGGGTIMGLAGLIGISDFAVLEKLASEGHPPDLLVKHKLPETDGTPVGDLIIAHFARSSASLEDKAAGIFSFAAASIFKDLAVLRSMPFSPKDIVVIGSVARSEVFRSHLRRFEPHLKAGTGLHFPDDGAHAAAIGACLTFKKG